MGRHAKTYRKVLAGSEVHFQALHSLLLVLGSELARISCSHHIYLHRERSELINLQPQGKSAKAYQVRQVRDVLLRCDLKLDD